MPISDAEEVDGFSGYESFMTYSIFILFIIFILGTVYGKPIRELHHYLANTHTVKHLLSTWRQWLHE